MIIYCREGNKIKTIYQYDNIINYESKEELKDFFMHMNEIKNIDNIDSIIDKIYQSVFYSKKVTDDTSDLTTIKFTINLLNFLGDNNNIRNLQYSQEIITNINKAIIKNINKIIESEEHVGLMVTQEFTQACKNYFTSEEFNGIFTNMINKSISYCEEKNILLTDLVIILRKIWNFTDINCLDNDKLHDMGKILYCIDSIAEKKSTEQELVTTFLLKDNIYKLLMTSKKIENMVSYLPRNINIAYSNYSIDTEKPKIIKEFLYNLKLEYKNKSNNNASNKSLELSTKTSKSNEDNNIAIIEYFNNMESKSLNKTYRVNTTLQKVSNYISTITEDNNNFCAMKECIIPSEYANFVDVPNFTSGTDKSDKTEIKKGIYKLAIVLILIVGTIMGFWYSQHPTNNKK